MRKLTVILLIVFCVVLCLGTALILRWVQEIPYNVATEADFMANVADSGGVDIASAFTMSFPEKVSAASVNRCLTVEPEIDLGLHQGGSQNEVLVVPAEPLQPQTLYTFTMRTEGGDCVWAFQTKAPLMVEETSPAHEELLVATSAPLKIMLNQMLEVDLDRATEFVHIVPETAGAFSQYGRVLAFTPDDGWREGMVYRVEILQGLPLMNSDITLAEGVSFAFETSSPLYRAENSKWELSGKQAYHRAAPPKFMLSLASPLEASTLPGTEEDMHNAFVQLFQYEDAGSYADALMLSQEKNPEWSLGRKNLRDMDLSHAVLRSSMGVSLTETADGLSLIWPTVPPEGYYLLRLTFQGQTRDMLFAVSSLAAALLPGDKQTLLWLHDSLSGAPVAATVTGIGSGVSVQGGDNGLAWLAPSDADGEVYLITGGEKTLVLSAWEQVADEGNHSNWRYLYLDKSVYESGDTLNYWGLAQPRGGTALEYKRVSVYIYPEQGGYIYYDFAPLTDNMFSGSIELPTLRDGAYTLEIWQSGRMLVGQSFYLGAAAAKDGGANQPVGGSANTSENSLHVRLNEAGGYDIGGGFRAEFAAGAGEYLFWEESGGEIIGTAASAAVSAVGGGIYIGVFSPTNYLDEYVHALYWDGAEYTLAAPALLALDYRSRALSLELDMPATVSGGGEDFSVTVTDAEGKPVANAQVAISLILSAARSAVDPLVAIYEDYQPAGFGGEPAPAKTSLSSSRATDFFAVLTTDSAGIAHGKLEFADGNGEAYLLAQAISAGEGAQVRAGAITKSIILSAAALTPDNATAEEGSYDYYIRPFSGNTAFDVSSGQLLIIASEQRLKLLAMLLDASLGLADDIEHTVPAKTAIALAASRQSLAEYGGEYFDALLPIIDCGAYQRENGGLGDIGGTDMLDTSVKAAALKPPGIDQFALREYFRAQLTQSASRLQYCQALAGLAIFRQPVLTEINALLMAEDLNASERLWLIWGLYYCGDLQTVRQALMEMHAQVDSLSAEQLALISVLHASLGSSGDALYTLADANSARQAGAYATEETLVARSLLPGAEAAAGEFRYTSGGDEVWAALGENRDYFLDLRAAEGKMEFRTKTEGLYYCYIYAPPAILAPEAEKAGAGE